MDSLGETSFFPLLETSVWGWVMATLHVLAAAFPGGINPPSPNQPRSHAAKGFIGQSKLQQEVRQIPAQPILAERG